MTSSSPPVAHLAPCEAYALARQRQAMRLRPLSIDALLSGCSHYEELVDFDDRESQSGIVTVRPGSFFTEHSVNPEAETLLDNTELREVM